ncbi:MAG: nicotinate (nicotinamide) nucleotide adenylyltransferase [Nitrospirota bacterium]|nr:nicotinate (nicotinamide) nucleotide adenylyltransferase [Nitrospirota bacterium]
MGISEGHSRALYPGKKPTLALFGGAFNPVHYGHITLASEIEARLGLSEIFFIPTGHPPHKEIPDVSCDERRHMVDLAISGHPGWRSTDIECRLEGPSYSARTIEHLGIEPPPFFVMGEDAFVDFWDWGRPEEILSRTHLVIVNRPGVIRKGVEEALLTVLRAAQASVCSRSVRETLRESEQTRGREHVWGLPLFGSTIRFLKIDALPVSSTDLRKLLAGERKAECSDLLPEGVKSYIVKRGYYQGSPKGGDLVAL